MVEMLPVERQRGLTERYDQQQALARQSNNLPARPDDEPADERVLGLFPRKSAQQKRYEEKLRELYRLGKLTRATYEWLLVLEYDGLRKSVGAVAAMEALLFDTVPGSVTARVAEEMFLEAVARIRRGIDENIDNFRRRSLGG